MRRLLAMLVLTAMALLGPLAPPPSQAAPPPTPTAPLLLPIPARLTPLPAPSRLPTVSVPRALRIIRWCEAGRYLGLPQGETNYTAKTHGHDGSSGGYQMMRTTYREWARRSGRGLRWAAAFLAPPAIQDYVATWGYLHSGKTTEDSPWRWSASCWAGLI